jgi:putative methionine-R-sulfoxide reductase with GAF domain
LLLLRAQGKTFTLMGDEENPGITILAVNDVFDYIKRHPQIDFHVQASYMEIYNEEIKDLLAPAAAGAKKLMIIEDKTFGPTCSDLRNVAVLSPEHCLELIAEGENARHFGSTNMNEHSSRSHTLFKLSVERRSGGEMANTAGHSNMANLAKQFKALQQDLDIDRSSMYLKDSESGDLWVMQGDIVLRLPGDVGIAGTVATTGKVINLQDCYQDARFNQQVDRDSGYRTENMLCMAIRDTSATEGEVIGVLQLMNKHDGYFTDEDEAKVRLSMGETLHTSFTRFSGRGEHDLS